MSQRTQKPLTGPTRPAKPEQTQTEPRQTPQTPDRTPPKHPQTHPTSQKRWIQAKSILHDTGGRSGVVCAECSLRSRCTTSKTGRWLVIHPHNRLLTEARQR